MDICFWFVPLLPLGSHPPLICLLVWVELTSPSLQFLLQRRTCDPGLASQSPSDWSKNGHVSPARSKKVNLGTFAEIIGKQGLSTRTAVLVGWNLELVVASVPPLRENPPAHP